MLNPPRYWSVACVLCAFAALGCEPEIGDECTLASECSQNGDRLCLTESQERFPGGYCTLFNCDPGGCPDEAVCIGYRTQLASAPECDNPFERPRLQRSFCMRSCSSEADCRSGYACIDISEANPWGAAVLEDEGQSGKICALEYLSPDLPEEHKGEVCESVIGQRSDAGLQLTPLADDRGADAGNSGGPHLDASISESDAARPDATAADAGRADAAR